MNRPLLPTLPLLLLLLVAACGRDKILVLPERLAPGGGDGGDGRTAIYAGPVLNIVVRMQADSTNFNPQDLIRLEVNGVNRAEEMDIGGFYAILALDPAPPSSEPQFVELARRLSEPFDAFTYRTEPYTGPTVTAVDPTEAVVSTDVEITGTGFDAGALRVYFGGVEGAVVGSDANSITATVPADALPGLVWVLVGADAAEGIVGFQPLANDLTPIDKPTTIHLSGHFPARGPVETAVRFYGYNFTNLGIASFSNFSSFRVIEPETVTLPVIGDILVAWAVPFPGAPVGDGEFKVNEFGVDTNELPFRIEQVLP